MANIFGTNTADFLRGTDDKDLILGEEGGDVLLGEGDNDNLRGGRDGDTLDGGQGDDNLLGQGGVDVLRGSEGNDLLDGGSKSDTADYSDLGQKITLQAGGAIDKGSAGTDQILKVENIIGAQGQSNLIDGSTGTSGSTSFNVSLQNERLVVKNIPGQGDIDFRIENFVDVIGTTEDDRIEGDRGDNVLQGNAGTDILRGTAGDDTIAGNRLDGDDDNANDTVDYTGLREAITLLPTGIVEKDSGLGTDVLLRVETIIGDTGQDNVIDGSDAEGADILVDLANESLQVEIDPLDSSTPLGRILENFIDLIADPPDSSTTLNRTVKNFVDVIGTPGNDRIFDNDLNNSLSGGRGNDILQSGIGDDTLIGDSGRDELRADFGQDSLTSGDGQDLFVLGENGDVFFDDAGDADFASLEDFESGTDIIQLAGIFEAYSFFSAGSNSFISLDSNNNNAFDRDDELIAKVNGTLNTSGDLVFA